MASRKNLSEGLQPLVRVGALDEAKLHTDAFQKPRVLGDPPRNGCGSGRGPARGLENQRDGYVIRAPPVRRGAPPSSSRSLGVKKIKRSDVVVVRVSHHHQPGRQERLELQLSGCELIANNTKPRAGELNGLSSLRRRLRKALSFMFWSLWMISKFLKRLACQSLISGVRLP